MVDATRLALKKLGKSRMFVLVLFRSRSSFSRAAHGRSEVSLQFEGILAELVWQARIVGTRSHRTIGYVAHAEAEDRKQFAASSDGCLVLFVTCILE